LPQPCQPCLVGSRFEHQQSVQLCQMVLAQTMGQRGVNLPVGNKIC